MEVITNKVHLVQPANNDHTQKSNMWLSNLDLLFKAKYSDSIFIYKPTNNTSKFFDIEVMKSALAKALVPYYPYAGRLAKDSNGRLEICFKGDCGVKLVEASCDSTIEDIRDFTPRDELAQFVPSPTEHLPPGGETDMNSAYLLTIPLLMAQITYFKCGGVCLGVASEHNVADGLAAASFTNTWANIAKGTSQMKMTPSIDRSALKARDPPRPCFSHPEYSRRVSTTDSHAKPELSVEVFKFTKEQMAKLRSDAKANTYKAFAAHVWRSVCIARDVGPYETTSMEVLVDGRTRLSLPLHDGYFGNAIFLALPTAKCVDLVSNSVRYAAEVVHQAVAKLDGDYIRSAIDHLEAHPFQKSAAMYRNPNLLLNTWASIPFYEADFGWGKPVYVGPSRIAYEGYGYILPSPPHVDDGSVSFAFALPSHHMKKFRRVVFQFCRSSL